MAEGTVLVIEDEENLQEALKYNLEREGYDVLTASDGERGLGMAREKRPDLVILDIMLPHLDGLEVCRILRREHDTPIIMLTAKGEEVDRVVGLELGADDYITKPFSMRELLARLRSVLRRTRSHAHDVALPSNEVLTSGDLQVNLAGHTVHLGERELDLKPREFDLLALLVANKGRAFTRDQILERLWGQDYIGDTRTVDVHIRWIRQKLETVPGSPNRIVTIRGVGYRFQG
ncbi:MAG: response regulator transcription factor [Chloroflexi bacterium]|nr:response regulator transcription factor [Chloroflexota bacterium]